jgi:UDP-glucose 4-epimerase
MNSQSTQSESVITRILNCAIEGREFELRTRSNNITPIRDYIDVNDVAKLVTSIALSIKPVGLNTVNACTGRGINLSRLIEECENVVSEELGIKTKLLLERTDLGPSEILNSIGDPSFAKSKFDWNADISLRESIRREFSCHESH